MNDGLAATVRSTPANSAETGAVGREAGPRAPESAELDDGLARAIGIPAFGIAIPRLTGLLEGLALGTIVECIGSVLFVALAAAIWHGNRWLLFEQRRRLGWFDHPAQKVMMLLAAVVLYTVPITIVGLMIWYAIAGLAADVVTIRTVVLCNVVCVVFVTHVYETVFLVKERLRDRLRVAQLDRGRTEAELAAFLAQVDPHFLFNSLNTLGHLIDTDTARARRFADGMGGLYRYLLRQRGHALVPIDEELEFVRDYVELMQVRFGPALRVHSFDRRVAGRWLVPPTGLQLLVENAIKHNEVAAAHPLDIEIEIGGETVTVTNARRPRRSLQSGEGVGLRNLAERMRLIGGRVLEVHETPARFTVVLPLLPDTADAPARPGG